MSDTEQVSKTRNVIGQLEQQLDRAVAAARAHGATWDTLADALGVARQSAWRKYKQERIMPKTTDNLCSFCGERQEDLKHLVLAPTGAAICGDCVDLAHEMVAAERTKAD